MGATQQPTTKQIAAFVEQRIQDGNASLQVGDVKAARDSFDDAMRLDPNNVDAAQGLAIAYLRLALPARAMKILQPLAMKHSTDRAIVINYTAACVASKAPMPGVKLLKAVMQQDPNDQEAADAMQIALGSADEHAKQSRLYEDANAFLQQYIAKLAVNHPGERYWGVQWLPAAQVEREESAINGAQKNVTSIRQEIKTDQKKVDQLANQISQTQRRGHTLVELNREKGELATAQGELERKQKELTQAMAAVPKAPIPEQVSAVLATIAAPPAVAVASPAPSPSSNSNPPAPAAPTSPPPVSPQAVSPPAPALVAKKRSREAACFAVTPDMVVTSAEVVAGAQDIAIQSADSTDIYHATVEQTDDASGLALLRVQGSPLACLAIAKSSHPGAVTCIGFPEVRLFGGSAELIKGSITTAGIAALSRHPRLAGAPLLAGNQVVAVELASRDQEQNAIPIATLQQLQHLLANVNPPASPAADPSTAVMTLIATRRSD